MRTPPPKPASAPLLAPILVTEGAPHTADVTKCVAPSPRLTATLPVWYGSEALLADSGRYLQRRGGSVWCVVEIVVP